ncbi:MULTISPECIES: hypothetical protein [Streptomyces]|uniref:CBM6 domain-containing protein n=2 Tax=Streptomyces TaxID=1883 RepID=A0A117IXQ9_9ACTN|nr:MULTISPECIES: hypothetical protein [Streptomyces]KUH40638.1 hypothetical protein ATE80_00075 [Streptomyces kanasensis]UUS29521.1 hypothetical protein NRO40_00870 [Streptomyces changanensis]
MRQSVRIWGAGIAAAAVVAGSVGAAVAVTSPSPVRHQPAAAAPAFTAKASTKSVRAWEQFRVRGVARNLAPGSRVTLQQKLSGRSWTTLPASMNTNSRSKYNMRVVLGMKGHNKLRLVDNSRRVVSPVMDVFVR